MPKIKKIIAEMMGDSAKDGGWQCLRWWVTLFKIGSDRPENGGWGLNFVSYVHFLLEDFDEGSSFSYCDRGNKVNWLEVGLGLGLEFDKNHCKDSNILFMVNGSTKLHYLKSHFLQEVILISLEAIAFIPWRLASNSHTRCSPTSSHSKDGTGAFE